MLTILVGHASYAGWDYCLCWLIVMAVLVGYVAYVGCLCWQCYLGKFVMLPGYAVWQCLLSILAT
jgi:hypothetical protein